ncbi:phosphoinositide 3-kinase regulatory subunit 4 [Elysia marginata]|uniref:Phosphoinositide 3-kinase regulatory subunit 4 n=1 Tax=Elysia marginata TaxID=1093978 RepID=A0AAV4FLI2_9GAST|nr:phosphoinositide 3-kinase regulatory subunit 4 [Elysia marginata]
MGNQLTGKAPAVIYPVEHYLNDIPSYDFDCGLGSTRFFKVGRARCKEGLVVVRVFVIHDPSIPLPLKENQDRLDAFTIIEMVSLNIQMEQKLSQNKILRLWLKPDISAIHSLFLPEPIN